MRRRHNPGMGGIKGALKGVVKVGVPALVAGGISGFVDSKFLSSQSFLIRTLVRLAEAAAVGFAFKRNPVMAYSAMGGILGSIGYEQGVRFAGGAVVGSTPVSKAAGVSALITEDPRAMGVLVQSMRGMGLQLDTGVSLGAGTALDSGLPANSYVDVNLG